MLTKINNTNTNFQGIKVQTLKTPLRQIDIYSLNKRDQDFIDRMLNVVKGHQMPSDRFTISDGSSRKVYDTALNKAKALELDDNDKVLLAVENNKKITGLMSIKERGDIEVDGLTTFDSDKTTLKSLFTAAINETKKLKNFALIIPEEKLPENMRRVVREFGFRIPKLHYNRDMVIECEDLQAVSQKLNSDVKLPNARRFTDLSELFSD